MLATLNRKRTSSKTALGQVTDPVSIYQPSKEVADITSMVMRDYQQGYSAMHKSMTEFNNRTLVSEVDLNQKAFNSYVPPRSEDPDESWRAQTVRPITRNKLISIAAHITANVLYPSASAQNDADDEDRDAALVMRYLLEWAINNSNYTREFINAIIGALVNPATIVHQSFAEVMRTVKDMAQDGSYTEKEILDTVLSGFQTAIVPVTEMLIANVYEPNIQKQRFLAWNKLVDFEEAKLVHGKKENFKYVMPGVRSVFDPETNTFYNHPDAELKGTLVNEVVYYNRALDLELVFINGILVSNVNQPNPRKDKMYPFAKSGYEPLNDGKFFYYKSAAAKLSSDQGVIDTLYNMVLDGTYLALMPPMALYGSEDVNSSVTIPGVITHFTDPNTKLESIAPRSDVRAGIEAMTIAEQSVSESSQDNSRAGVGSSAGGRTAREVLLLDQNARVALGLFGKMVGFFVEDVGELLKNDILQYMTVGEMVQIGGSQVGMKYKSFMVPNKIVDGKKVGVKIKFKDPALSAMISENAKTQEAMLDESFDILEMEGGPDADKKIYMVNPEIFRSLRYKIKVNVEELTPTNKSLEKALNLEAYDRAIQNPVADQEAVTRDFLFDTYRPGESSKYIRKAQPAPTPAMPGADQGQPFQQKGVNGNLVGQMTGSNSLGVAASGME